MYYSISNFTENNRKFEIVFVKGHDCDLFCSIGLFFVSASEFDIIDEALHFFKANVFFKNYEIKVCFVCFWYLSFFFTYYFFKYTMKCTSIIVNAVQKAWGDKLISVVLVLIVVLMYELKKTREYRNLQGLLLTSYKCICVETVK